MEIATGRLKLRNLNYNELASAYARHRVASSLVLDELQRGRVLYPGSKVLEAGCGTGSHLRALVKSAGGLGWGVDPSPEMLRHALGGDSVHFLQGSAEELPFGDGLFDLVFSVNVIHHMKNTISYFCEALRVLKPDGVVCTVTDSEKIIRNRKPLARYWPGTVQADLKRYPAIALLRQQMIAVGLVDIEEHEIRRAFKVTDVAPYREKAFSCLHLISEEEFLSGLRRLEPDLKAGPVQGVSEYVCLWGRCPEV